MSTPPAPLGGVTWDDLVEVIWITAATWGALAAIAFVWDLLVVTLLQMKRVAPTREGVRRMAQARHQKPQDAKDSVDAPRHLHSHPHRRRHFRFFHRATLWIGGWSRAALLKWLRPYQRRYGRLLELTNLIFSILVVIQYFIRTYTGTTEDVTDRETTLITALVFNSFFAARYIAKFLLWEPGSRFSYVASLIPIIDVVTIVSSILPEVQAVDTFLTFTYLRVIIIYANVKNLQSWIGGAFLCNVVQQQVMVLIVLLIAFIVTMGASVMTVERAGNFGKLDDVTGASSGNDKSYTGYNSLYWALITSTTVGYGDITPVTFFGRLLTMLFLVSAVIYASALISSVIDLTEREAKGLGAFNNWRRKLTILVVGDANRTQLLDILAELFLPTLPQPYSFLHVVVMMDEDSFSAADKAFFKGHRFYRNVVTYIRGSVFSRADLVRASAHRPETEAVLVVASQASTDDDRQNISRVLALRRHLSELPLFVMCRQQDSLQYLSSAGIQSSNVLLLDTVRFGLLSANALAPGVIPLLLPLFSSQSSSHQASQRSNKELRRSVELQVLATARAKHAASFAVQQKEKQDKEEEHLAKRPPRDGKPAPASAPGRPLLSAVDKAAKRMKGFVFAEEIPQPQAPQAQEQPVDVGEDLHDTGRHGRLARIQNAAGSGPAGQLVSSALGMMRRAGDTLVEPAPEQRPPRASRKPRAVDDEEGEGDGFEEDEGDSPTDADKLAEEALGIEEKQTAGAEQEKEAITRSRGAPLEPGGIELGTTSEPQTGGGVSPSDLIEGTAASTPAPADVSVPPTTADGRHPPDTTRSPVIGVPPPPQLTHGKARKGMRESITRTPRVEASNSREERLPTKGPAAMTLGPEAIGPGPSVPDAARTGVIQDEGTETQLRVFPAAYPGSATASRHSATSSAPQYTGVVATSYLAIEAEFGASMRGDLHQVAAPSWLFGLTPREAACVAYCSPLATTLLKEKRFVQRQLREAARQQKKGGRLQPLQPVPSRGSVTSLLEKEGIVGLLQALEDETVLEATAPVMLLGVLAAGGVPWGQGTEGTHGHGAESDLRTLRSFRQLMAAATPFGHAGAAPSAGSAAAISNACLLMDFTSDYRIKPGDELFLVFGEPESTPTGHEVAESGLPAVIAGCVHRYENEESLGFCGVAEALNASSAVKPPIMSDGREPDLSALARKEEKKMRESLLEQRRKAGGHGASGSSASVAEAVLRARAEMTGRPMTATASGGAVSNQGLVPASPPQPRRRASSESSLPGLNLITMAAASAALADTSIHIRTASKGPDSTGKRLSKVDLMLPPPLVIRTGSSFRGADGEGPGKLRSSSQNRFRTRSASALDRQGRQKEKDELPSEAEHKNEPSVPPSSGAVQEHPKTPATAVEVPSPPSSANQHSVDSRASPGAPSPSPKQEPQVTDERSSFADHILVISDDTIDRLRPLLGPLLRFVGNDVVIFSSGLSDDLPLMEPVIEPAADVLRGPDAAIKRESGNKKASTAPSTGSRSTAGGNSVGKPSPSEFDSTNSSMLGPSPPMMMPGAPSPSPLASMVTAISNHVDRSPPQAGNRRGPPAIAVVATPTPSSGPSTSSAPNGKVAPAALLDPSPSESSVASSAPASLLSLASRTGKRKSAKPQPRVILLRGDPLKPSNLLAAGLLRCRRIIVLSRVGLAAASNAAGGSGSASSGSGSGGGDSGDSSSLGSAYASTKLVSSALMFAGDLSVDVPSVLNTLLLESVLSTHVPRLLSGTTSEFTSNASFLLLGPVPRSSPLTGRSTPYPRVGQNITVCPPCRPTTPSSPAPTPMPDQGRNQKEDDRRRRILLAGRGGSALTAGVVAQRGDGDGARGTVSTLRWHEQLGGELYRPSEHEKDRHSDAGREEGQSTSSPSSLASSLANVDAHVTDQRAARRRQFYGVPNTSAQPQPPNAVARQPTTSSHDDGSGGDTFLGEEPGGSFMLRDAAVAGPGTRPQRGVASDAGTPTSLHDIDMAARGQSFHRVPTGQSQLPPVAPGTNVAVGSAARGLHAAGRLIKGCFRRCFRACRRKEMGTGTELELSHRSTPQQQGGIQVQVVEGTPSAGATGPTKPAEAPPSKRLGRAKAPAKPPLTAQGPVSGSRPVSVDRYPKTVSGLTGSYRFASGRIMPLGALNGLVTHAFFNPGGLSLLHALCRGEGACVRHMRIPTPILKDLEGLRRLRALKRLAARGLFTIPEAPGGGGEASTGGSGGTLPTDSTTGGTKQSRLSRLSSRFPSFLSARRDVEGVVYGSGETSNIGMQHHAAVASTGRQDNDSPDTDSDDESAYRRRRSSAAASTAEADSPPLSAMGVPGDAPAALSSQQEPTRRRFFSRKKLMPEPTTAAPQPSGNAAAGASKEQREHARQLWSLALHPMLKLKREDYDVCSFSTLNLLMMFRYGLPVLGLYRNPEWLSAPLPYVQASPPLLSRVRPGDVLFVLLPVGAASIHPAVAEALL